MRWMIPLLLIMSASAACAETVVTVETVPVADVGNVADSVTGYGSVGYAYRIGKFEVTIGQYAAFLNSVARSNTNTYIVNLWSGGGATPGGMTNGNIAGIARTGSLGAYTYTVVGPYGGVQLSQTSASNRPVTEVSWFDAARFCNWLHNGATNGADTEMGAYTLNGATSGIVTKNSDARWWIPTYNEWFKAAYYKGGGSNAGYWLYATQSDSPPGNQPGGALNQANYKVANKFSVTQSTVYSPSQNYLLDVGAFSNSASAYGTFDQAASVWEWNDAVFGADSRGVMGGSWANPDSWMQRSGPGSAMADNKGGMGFRVASVPERVSLEAASTKSPFDPATAANWSAGGTEWTVDAAVSHDGVDSVKAQTTDGQSTYREYTVTGPAVVDFWWKVSSEELYDTFSWSVNGVNQQTISGEVDWTYRTLTLPAGTHTIRWTYTKDGSDAVGQDAGWLDDFVVYPATATMQVRDGSTVLDGDVTVDFGSADQGSAGLTKLLTFLNQGYVPIEAQLSLPQGSPFTFDSGAATFGLLIGRGESVDVPIFLSGTSAGNKSGQLTISAPESATAPPSITLTGYVRGPEIGMAEGTTALTSGQTFDMGLAPRTVEFTIRNNGNVGDLVIAGISATGNFQVTQQPATTIPPQTSTTFKVLAQSTATGAQAGSISITSNAGNSAEFSLALTSRSFAGIPEGITDGSWTTAGNGGAAVWNLVETTLPSGHAGVAAVTGTTPNNGESVLSMITSGPGVLSWSWRVSTQENFDWLLCEVDGREVAGISSKNGAWQEQAIHVAGGSIVRWVYRKDSTANAGEDRGYIANAAITRFTGTQTSYDFSAPPFAKAGKGLPAIFGWLGHFDAQSGPSAAVYGVGTAADRGRFHYPISKTAKGLVQLEFSKDLVNWSGRNVEQRVLSDDPQRVVIEAAVSNTSNGFFRLYPIAIPDTASANFNSWRQSARSSLDSVYEINRIISGNLTSSNNLSFLKANVDHLKIVSARAEYIYYPFFQTREEFASIARAITEGEAYWKLHKGF